MTEFTKVYRKWHAENNGKYVSAIHYHKALQSRFGNWKSPSSFRKLQYELNNSEMMLGLKKVAVKNLLSEKRQLRQEIEKLKSDKQIVVVPQIIADAIESIPDHYSAYGAIKLIDMKLTELPLENEDWKYVHDWIFVDDNANKFVKAWIDGYMVDKEQLYEVVFYVDEEDDRCLLMKTGKTISFEYESQNEGHYQQQFTEQEIKAIDKRYFEFAVKVDEVNP